MSDRLLFSVAGARGIVGRTIDPDVVVRLCAAFSAAMPEGRVVLGRDTRPSGEAFARAAAAALLACGRDVIDLGVATTPTTEMATERHGAAAGVIVTASHNPAEWNALKFLDGRGIFIDPDTGARVLEHYERGTFHWADGRGYGRRVEDPGASRAHIDAILALEALDVEAIRRRRFRVVLDCINGAGSVIAPELLRELGAEVVELHCEPSGDFVRDPEPRAEHLGELAERVRAEGADVGFAADPDADRLALVDETGRAISEEYTLALAVDGVLERTSGPVVVNLSTASLVEHVARRHGVSVERTPVGEAHVVARMLETGAVIGGEGNGGVIYPALHPGRDAPLGMALILQILASSGQALSERIAAYPPFHMTKAKRALAGPFDTEAIASEVTGLGADSVDTRDGVRATFGDAWIHLRVSNTEGVVRVIAEAPDAEGTRRLEALAARALDRVWANS